MYEQAGEYSEIVKVTDSAGNFAYDFAVVYVIDRKHPERVPLAIHANYYPTFGPRANDEVVFKVRSFGTQHGEEVAEAGQTWHCQVDKDMTTVLCLPPPRSPPQVPSAPPSEHSCRP